MKRLIIFASGEGTNAENLIRYFRKNKKAEVIWLITNRPCGAVARGLSHDVPTLILDRGAFFKDQKFLAFLQHQKPDLIVLAGFLLLVPQELTRAFPGKIINIHPALLPKFGGKGMYGKKVHEAVIAAGEKQSGISIHEVNERFDEGKILFQATCPVEPDDTADTLASRIHALEYEHFPAQIGKLLGV